MPIEFTVVGEDRADSQWLLVKGSDGHYYRYHPRRARLTRVEPDERWVRYREHEPEVELRDQPTGPMRREA
jgi:hypothetical protein